MSNGHGIKVDEDIPTAELPIDLSNLGPVKAITRAEYEELMRLRRIVRNQWAFPLFTGAGGTCVCVLLDVLSTPKAGRYGWMLFTVLLIAAGIGAFRHWWPIEPEKVPPPTTSVREVHQK